MTRYKNMLYTSILVLLLCTLVYPLNASIKMLPGTNTLEYKVSTGEDELKEVEVFYLVDNTQQDYEKMLISKEKVWTKEIDTPGTYGIKVLSGGEVASAYLKVDAVQQQEQNDETPQYALLDPKIAYPVAVILIIIIIYSIFRVIRIKRRKK